ncbi:MAG: tRNA (adenosine(37)-N6)-threonylcarbamoyltransferase complex dimerization subunit type 1 TsaB [Myxococcota bacterium]
MNDEEFSRTLLQVSTRAGGPLLAIDTSSRWASICTVGWAPGEVREDHLPAAAMPSESLVSHLARQAAAASFAFDSLRGIVVGMGPGSFTGLRVGLATVKGLAAGYATPLYGVSSLSLMAAAYGPGRVWVALDARRGEIFSATYKVTESGETQVLIPDGARNQEQSADMLLEQPPDVIVGEAAHMLCDWLGLGGVAIEPDPRPRAAAGVIDRAAQIEARKIDHRETAVPRYMRLSTPEEMALKKQACSPGEM